jgi:polar amino acid transport system substrate-binding protein
LTYFVQQSNGQLELAAVGQANGFDDLFQGTVVPKDSPLGPVILEAYKKLYENGTYAAIMKKWGLANNMLKTPGINLAGKRPQ